MQGGFRNDKVHGKKLLIMTYVIVIVLADSSEADELVQQITSKRKKFSWTGCRKHQRDFFFRLLRIPLAVHAHIHWCF